MIIPFFPSLIPLLSCPEKLSFIFLDYMNLHIYGCVYTKGWHMYLFVLYTHASMYLWANIKSSLIPGLGRSTGEGIGYPLQYSWASLVAKESVCNAGDLGSIPGLRRSPGEGKG